MGLHEITCENATVKSYCVSEINILCQKPDTRLYAAEMLLSEIIGDQKLTLFTSETRYKAVFVKT